MDKVDRHVGAVFEMRDLLMAAPNNPHRPKNPMTEDKSQTAALLSFPVRN
jgi:hypothetical protein